MISAEGVGLWSRCRGLSEGTVSPGRGAVSSFWLGGRSRRAGSIRACLLGPRCSKAQLWRPLVPGHTSSTPSSAMAATLSFNIWEAPTQGTLLTMLPNGFSRSMKCVQGTPHANLRFHHSLTCQSGYNTG